MPEVISAEDRAAVLKRSKDLIDELAPVCESRGLVRRGNGYWREGSGGKSFAGIWINAWPVRLTKRFDVMAIALCGYEQLHGLCWPAHRKPKPFSIGPDFAQFEHHIVDVRSGGFVAKKWSLWPSTRVRPLADEIASRIIAESVPALDTMLDRKRLAAQLRAQRTVAIIPRSHYNLTPEILDQLER